MLKQGTTRYSIMESKIDLSPKGLFYYTFPLLLSAILEELMILTDTVLLSFKEPVFLATVGILDSIYLLFLAMGESLNDAFQNYYARHIDGKEEIGQVFQLSLLIFFILAFIFCFIIIIATFFVQPEWIGIEHYRILNSSKVYLCILVFVTYISLSLNSLLMGVGKTKELGMVSMLTVIVNIVLGYLLLFKCEININPCGVILLTSIIAETIAIIIMVYMIWRENKTSFFFKKKVTHKGKIVLVLTGSAFYPCITDLMFHIGSLCLYLYCLTFFKDNDTATFTLLMSYWGVIQVPAQSFSETSLNVFSYIHSSNRNKQYKQLRTIIIKLSVIISLLFGISISLFDAILYDYDGMKFLSILLIVILSILNTPKEIISVTLISRLKTDYYLIAHFIYGSFAVLFIVAFSFLFGEHYINVIIAFLLSIAISNVYLVRQERKIWELS